MVLNYRFIYSYFPYLETFILSAHNILVRRVAEGIFQKIHNVCTYRCISK